MHRLPDLCILKAGRHGCGSAPRQYSLLFQANHTGTWCSGIASAPHAEGPGFKSQCVHLSRMACVNCTCVPSATAHLRAFLHVVSELPHPWPRYFPVLAEAHCIKHQISQRIRKREKKKQIMFFESSTWVFLTYHCIMGHMV